MALYEKENNILNICVPKKYIQLQKNQDKQILSSKSVHYFLYTEADTCIEAEDEETTSTESSQSSQGSWGFNTFHRSMGAFIENNKHNLRKVSIFKPSFEEEGAYCFANVGQ